MKNFPKGGCGVIQSIKGEFQFPFYQHNKLFISRLWNSMKSVQYFVGDGSFPELVFCNFQLPTSTKDLLSVRVDVELGLTGGQSLCVQSLFSKNKSTQYQSEVKIEQPKMIF